MHIHRCRAMRERVRAKGSSSDNSRNHLYSHLFIIPVQCISLSIAFRYVVRLAATDLSVIDYMSYNEKTLARITGINSALFEAMIHGRCLKLLDACSLFILAILSLLLKIYLTSYQHAGHSTWPFICQIGNTLNPTEPIKSLLSANSKRWRDTAVHYCQHYFSICPLQVQFGFIWPHLHFKPNFFPRNGTMATSEMKSENRSAIFIDWLFFSENFLHFLVPIAWTFDFANEMGNANTETFDSFHVYEYHRFLLNEIRQFNFVRLFLCWLDVYLCLHLASKHAFNHW